MNDHPGAMPGWNLALRFLLEISAFVGWGWAGWHLADGVPAIVLTAALPAAAAAAWGVFAVPGDPSRSGNAPVPVPGWLRLIIELLVFAGGVAAFALHNAPVIGAILGALVVIHLGFSLGRTRWLLQQH